MRTTAKPANGDAFHDTVGDETEASGDPTKDEGETQSRATFLVGGAGEGKRPRRTKSKKRSGKHSRMGAHQISDEQGRERGGA